KTSNPPPSSPNILTGVLTVTNVTFHANTAAENGGAIYSVTNSNDSCATTNCNFPSVNISSSTFDSNSAHFGGAVARGQGLMNIATSKFVSNNSTDSAGAFKCWTSTNVQDPEPVTISNSTFDSNSSLVGGAVLNEAPAPLDIKDSVFANNQAN